MGLGAPSANRRHTLNRLLFPGPTKEFEAAQTTYGDVSILPTLESVEGADLLLVLRRRTRAR